jgi:hypothetical protein
MLQEEMEEQLQALTKRVEELSAEVETLKEHRSKEPELIPGAEYDFVPSVEPMVIARGVGRIVQITTGTHELGLSKREWEQFSSDEDTDE